MSPLVRSLLLFAMLATLEVHAQLHPSDSRSAFTKAIATSRIFGFMEIFRNSGLPEQMLHGDVTLIIPVDTSFYALAPTVYQRLLAPASRELAVAYIQAHVIKGTFTLDQIASGKAQTLAGQPVVLKPAATGQPATLGDRRVLLANQAGATGAFHLIDGFLVLP